jgi:hypothetical protein
VNIGQLQECSGKRRLSWCKEFAGAGTPPGKQTQILRLRARPTRKGSGSERPGGRYAQDDIIKVIVAM